MLRSVVTSIPRALPFWAEATARVANEFLRLNSVNSPGQEEYVVQVDFRDLSREEAKVYVEEDSWEGLADSNVFDSTFIVEADNAVDAMARVEFQLFQESEPKRDLTDSIYGLTFKVIKKEIVDAAMAKAQADGEL